jgi:maltoporin
MRRVLQLLGLSGLLVTGFVSTHAFAQEPSDAEQPAEEPKAEQPQAAPVAPVAVAPAAAAVAPAAQPKVGDYSVHGYFRGGFGANVREKGRQTCFQLNLGGQLSKYRLGNECEVWAELHTTTVVYAGEDGTVANLHFMPVAYIPTSYIGYTPTGVTSSDNGSPGTGATVAFPNLYVDIKGIDWLYGGTPWMGTRYYKRESIYISDFFYWNPSGVGAGIEDISLGKIWDSAPDVVRDLTFSYGVFAVDGQPSGSPQLPLQIDLGIRNDIQIRGIRPWQGGELQLGFQYIKDWSNDYSPQTDSVTNITTMVSNTHSGWGGTFQYVQDVLGGNNKVAVQYGVGGGAGFGTLSRFYYPDFSLNFQTTEWRFRALDVLTIQPLAWLGLQANLVFQHDKNSTPAAGNWISAGTRASFAFTEHAKVLVEVGRDQLKTKNGSGDRQLTKATGALAIAAAKGFWARPELRLFLTYAVWDKNAAIATVDSGRVYTNADDNGVYKLNAWVAGLQAEAMF